MNFKFIGSAALIGALVTGSAAAEDVLLTAQNWAKSKGSAVALDLATGGEATAFQFTVTLPKGVSHVDTSKCLAQLPKTHQGTCKFRPERNDVIVLGFSTTNAKLPGGIVALGELGITGADAQALDVKEIAFADANGRDLTARAEFSKPEGSSKPSRVDSESVK